jgi:hypothetical protein
MNRSAMFSERSEAITDEDTPPSTLIPEMAYISDFNEASST